MKINIEYNRNYSIVPEITWKCVVLLMNDEIVRWNHGAVDKSEIIQLWNEVNNYNAMNLSDCLPAQAVRK